MAPTVQCDQGRTRAPPACMHFSVPALMLLLSLAPWHASAAMPGCRSPSQQMIDPFRARQPPPCWACVCPQRPGTLYGALGVRLPPAPWCSLRRSRAMLGVRLPPAPWCSLRRSRAMLGARLPPAPWCSLRRSRASRVTLGVVCRRTPPAMPWRDGWSALDPRGQMGLEEGAEQVAARDHAAHGARAIDAHELAHVGVC
jgi:hypothetical protein